MYRTRIIFLSAKLLVMWYWCRNSNPLATWWEEPTYWQRLWFWDRLKAGGKGDNRRWDGWVASPTQWIWVWANARRQWRTRKPGVLQSMGIIKSQIRLSDWTIVTLNITENRNTQGRVYKTENSGGGRRNRSHQSGAPRAAPPMVLLLHSASPSGWAETQMPGPLQEFLIE